MQEQTLSFTNSFKLFNKNQSMYRVKKINKYQKEKELAMCNGSVHIFLATKDIPTCKKLVHLHYSTIQYAY